MDDSKQIRIQILAAREEVGRVGWALAVTRERLGDVVDIGREQGAEALLVCPAPEELVSEGIDIVIAARFGEEIDKEARFWRQHGLADEFHHALNVEALVLDLDSPLEEFLRNIEPMLALPYRDELGRRGSIGVGP
jgi:hypothetical protein